MLSAIFIYNGIYKSNDTPESCTTHVNVLANVLNMDDANMNRSVLDVRDELNNNMTMTVLPVTIFIGIEAFVGFFGNIVILGVYSRWYPMSNFRYFVLSMAAVDLTSSCTTLPGEIFSQINWYTYEFGWICKVKTYFNIFTAWGSASILLILAFDRYRKICRPLDWQIRPSLALKLCGCSMVVSAIVSIPVVIFWGKQTYIYEVDRFNVTVCVCEKSSEYANGNYPLIYILCVYVLPLGLMIFVAGYLNIITARRLFGQTLLEENLTNINSRLSTSHLSSTSLETELGVVSKTVVPHAGISEKQTGQSEVSTIRINSQKWLGANELKTYESVSFTINNTSVGAEVSGDNGKDTRMLSAVRNKKWTRTNSDVYVVNADVNENSEVSNIVYPERSRRTDACKTYVQRKQKTIILLILTSVYVITMSTYVILTSLVAKPDGVLKGISTPQKVVFFFFWRLYFINSAVNPIVYGFMDRRFRSVLASFLPGKI